MTASEARAGADDLPPDDVEALRRELDEERQRGLRLLAEFDTFRRRQAREHDAARDSGRRDALLPLLPVLETLDHALAAGSSDRTFYAGVEATRRMLIQALREAGAEPVESVGRPMDPRVHEVVATVPSDEFEPGTVVREVRRGWKLGDDLLRPAQVEVAAATERAEPWR
jgi:molecular chaperone GrpE